MNYFSFLDVKKSNLKYSNIFIYSWVFITITISVIDLVLFILFVIDYDTIFTHSFDVELEFSQPSSSILITAQNSAGMMMSVALRGYVLWLINIALAVYLFTQTFKIYDYVKLSANDRLPTGGQVNQAFSLYEAHNQSMYKNQPINAFEPRYTYLLVILNFIFIIVFSPWYNYLTTDVPRVPRPQTTLVRSTSVNGLEESFNRRMTNAHVVGNKNTFNSEVVLRRDQVTPATSAPSRQSAHLNNINYLQTPQPQFDNRPPLKSGILRNSRYQ